MKIKRMVAAIGLIAATTVSAVAIASPAQADVACYSVGSGNNQYSFQRIDDTYNQTQKMYVYYTSGCRSSLLELMIETWDNYPTLWVSIHDFQCDGVGGTFYTHNTSGGYLSLASAGCNKDATHTWSFSSVGTQYVWWVRVAGATNSRNNSMP